MATRGRKSYFGEPLTPGERKARFDEKMRNADGSEPGAPARKPVVIYLSDDAREALRNHRVERQLLRPSSGPRLDSELVEQLLLAIETRRTEGGTSSAAVPKPIDSGAVRAKTLARVIELRRRLRAAREENRGLRESVDELQKRVATLSAQAVATTPMSGSRNHEEDPTAPGASWDEIAKQLTHRQHDTLWLWAPGFLAAVREVVLTGAREPELIRVLARELDAHVARLCDEPR